VNSPIPTTTIVLTPRETLRGFLGWGNEEGTLACEMGLRRVLPDILPTDSLKVELASYEFPGSFEFVSYPIGANGEAPLHLRLPEGVVRIPDHYRSEFVDILREVGRVIDDELDEISAWVALSTEKPKKSPTVTCPTCGAEKK